jgi:pseudaminic acid biosynthesis-associated methylase
MKTDQEKFWSSDFGNKYTERTHLERKYFTTRVKMWSDILMHSNDIKSVFEIGSNTGINMEVIQFLLNKKISTNGIEINKKASLIAKKNKHKIKNISVLDYKPIKKFDMSVSCGVMIHINPKYLNKVYDVLYKSSKKYILISEYFNTQPVTINYRGFQDKLFKRDFAKEIQKKYKLKLIDYKFMWSKDNIYPCDDTTWFLFEKN